MTSVTHPSSANAAPSPRSNLFYFFLIAFFPLLFLPSATRYAHLSPPANDVLTLTKQMVNIPSPSGSEQRVLNHARSWFVSQGWNVATHPVPPSFALLATLASPSHVRVLLSTHLDVVPGPPLSRVEHGRLYGRGAVDAKGQAAALMLTAARLADPRVAVLLVPREETDHAGMASAHAFGLSSNITLLNAEPTESKLVHRQKGLLKAWIRARGEAAHSGYPHLGHSAVHHLTKVLASILHAWPDGEDTTVNVGLIQGGTAANVLATEAKALVLWRVSTNVDGVLARLEQILGEHQHISYQIVTRNEPLAYFVPPNVAAQYGTCTVAYNTDVPYYKARYSRAVLFGAGSIEQAHKDDEWISIEELRKLPHQLESIVSEILHS
ncbi:Peptidase M20 domain-containing protein [Gracilariopsis chorda]|uniref:Peptidase M20 domain-containing protein n=1 Tax=Gracilariopsis chorda TaxID=448386 RepID=A0A2V3ISS0_9FLOR|nr:Peptidase M20 domain-containing protein [Gracilariopsis chorda]|eukprot:PXF45168.1 Peptidase M20 domain-containing protein [Gracilariopsis chorda]